MSSHDASVLVYLVIVLIGVGLQVRSRHPGSRVPSLGLVLQQVMSRHSGRVGLLTAWAWLGLHFFVR